MDGIVTAFNSILEGGVIPFITSFFAIYICALWLIICIWVFTDAKKRYGKTSWAILFFFLVLVFNFPILILYVMIRPEREEDNILYLHGSEESAIAAGGINVPLVNFIGEDGFRLSLNISVANPKNAPVSNMDLNVGFNSADTNMVQQEVIEIAKTNTGKVEVTIEEKTPVEEKVARRFGGFINKLKNVTQNASKSIKSYGENLEEKIEETTEQAADKVEEVKEKAQEVVEKVADKKAKKK